MPGGIGPLELAIVLVIVLVVFGPKRLPGLGRSLGSGMKEFKDSITGATKADEDDDERDKPSIAQTSGDAQAPASQPATEPVSQPATEPVSQPASQPEKRDDAVTQPRG